MEQKSQWEAHDRKKLQDDSQKTEESLPGINSVGINFLKL